jgi:predicted unusual protein kinase regulating ubiquinone biosynthesis (AarF/ABC1/UbiB family)
VPISYRRLLGDLRDNNEPMSLPAFWHAIPRTLRHRIVKLGPCLGVGSVKQVHRAVFEDGSERAVAVLRANVEEEALASLNALQSSEEIGVVAQRLGRLVYGEFNLFGEGEALAEFASTRVGRHPRFRVVKVAHHSPKCLVEEIAEGPTLAQVLETPLLPDVPAAVVSKREKTKALLTEYHQTGAPPSPRARTTLTMAAR